MAALLNNIHKALRILGYVAVAFFVYVLLSNNAFFEAGFFYYLNAFFLVAMVIAEIFFNRKKRINLLNGRLQVQKGNAITREIQLGAGVRVVKGMNGVVIKGEGFEHSLRYKDFEKHSVWILKGL